MRDPLLNCTLCRSPATDHFHSDASGEYHRCARCALIFTTSEWHLSWQAQQSVYDLHQNNPLDMRYQKFLNRLVGPLAPRLSENSHGLDFGCGPGPTIAVMMAKLGHTVYNFDPIYFPDTRWQGLQYDFITATEVVEHLHQPAYELELLWSHVKPAGYLGIMTKRPTTLDAFKHWHYKQDPTHVSFYSEQTFQWLANHWGAKLDIVTEDAVIFQKSDDEP